MKIRKNRRKLLKNQTGIASLEGVVAFGTAIAILLFFYIGINTFFTEYEENSIEISAKTIGISEKSICGPGLASGWNMDWHNDELLNLTDFGLGTNDQYIDVSYDEDGNQQVNQFRLFGNFYHIEDEEIRPPPEFIADGYYRIVEDGPDEYIPGEIWLCLHPYTVSYFGSEVRYDLIPSEGETGFHLKMQLMEDFPYAILHGLKIKKLSDFPANEYPDMYDVVKDAIGLEWYVNFTINITQIDGVKLLDYGKIPDQWQTKESFSRIVYVENYNEDDAEQTGYGELAELVMTIYQ